MSNVERWERRNALHPTLGKVYVVLLLCLGLAPIWWTVSVFRAARASRNWSRTEGVITESRWITGVGPHRSGSADIRFRYTLNGQSYDGHNILAGGGEYYPDKQKEKVRQYRIGMTVPVFYDPKDPRSSCLEPGQGSEMSYVLLGIGLFFLFAALWLIWRLVRKQPITNRSGSDPPPAVEEYDFLPKK